MANTNLEIKLQAYRQEQHYSKEPSNPFLPNNRHIKSNVMPLGQENRLRRGIAAQEDISSLAISHYF